MSTSNMPARIWATDARAGLQMWSDSKWPIYTNAAYHRADIVERLVEALDGLVQRFDTFDGQPFVNPADSPWAIARSALAAYRKSINDET